jgi:hypothetical protein
VQLRSVTILALMLPLIAPAAQAQRPAASLSAQSAELAAGARLRIPSQPLLLPSGRTGPSLQLVGARPTKRTGETLMIVGGAVLLVGLLADETVISIAGVVIGGYGLYVYLDASPKRR